MNLNRTFVNSLIMLCACAFVEAQNQIVPPYVFPDHISKWKGNPYKGPIDVSITEEYGTIKVNIETQDLKLSSLTLDQQDDYIALFGDPEAVEKYADGNPWASEDVQMAVSGWVQRWEALRDPFSAFAVFSKKEGGQFIGHLVLGHGDRHGQSELAFLFKPQHKNENYAVQAVTAVIKGYIPRIVDYYLVNLNSSVQASPLHNVHATAHFDNTFAGQALIRSGFKIGVEEILWGAPRFHFLITLDQILNNNATSQDDDWIDGEN